MGKDFIDSKTRKWYPAEGNEVADENWREQAVDVHENARWDLVAGPPLEGNVEGFLPYPAVHFTDRERGPDDIHGIVIHTTEGWSGGGRTFMRGNREASAHYGIERDGTITKSVDPKHRAWQAPNVNEWTIGIEHAGFAKEDANGNPHPGFPLAQIKASAKLTAFLARKYKIPIDRNHIFGHNQNAKWAKPGAPSEVGTGNHSDPGPYWDWDSYIWWVKWYYYRPWVFVGGFFATTAALGYYFYQSNEPFDMG